jgi:hypothetical protein
MQRPAPEPGYFLKDETACIAEQMLQADASVLVSLKVRPIFGSGWNAYVYADEYAAIRNATDNFSLLSVSTSAGPCTQHYRISEGLEFLLVIRATGPEVITVVRSGAVFTSIIPAIVELVAMMVKIINERNEQKKAGGRVDRCYIVSAVSIEIRSRAGGKRLIQLNLPDQASIDPQILARTLGSTLQDLFPGKVKPKSREGVIETRTEASKLCFVGD